MILSFHSKKQRGKINARILIDKNIHIFSALHGNHEWTGTMVWTYLDKLSVYKFPMRKILIEWKRCCASRCSRKDAKIRTLARGQFTWWPPTINIPCVAGGQEAVDSVRDEFQCLGGGDKSETIKPDYAACLGSAWEVKCGATLLGRKGLWVDLGGIYGVMPV